jgi:site-specific DNA recombinase
MTLRTGTSKNKRVYRYYTCGNSATKGHTACKGRSIPMDKLDRLVTEHLSQRLFQPERLAAILASLSSRRSIKAQSLNSRLMALQKQVTDADEKLKRLYHLVEEGVTDLDDILKDRLNALKAERDRAIAALERTKDQSTPDIKIDPGLIERFGRTMQESFSTGSIPFRKAYLRALVDVVEVDDHQVRIKGNKDLLEKAILAQNTQPPCSQMSTKWRARRDSNSRPLDS